jgi:hypothetical protein
MTSLNELNERLDELWAEAEQFIEAYFRAHKEEVVKADGRTELMPQVPEMREFGLLCTCLKRIHEGRRLARMGEPQNGTDTAAHSNHSEVLNKEISRLLNQLQANNAEEGAAPNSLPD